jgi:hypothetical protein
MITTFHQVVFPTALMGSVPMVAGASGDASVVRRFAQMLATGFFLASPFPNVPDSTTLAPWRVDVLDETRSGHVRSERPDRLGA